MSKHQRRRALAMHREWEEFLRVWTTSPFGPTPERIRQIFLSAWD